MGGGEIDEYQVGIIPFFQHAAFQPPALGLGPAEGGHHQGGRAGQGSRVALFCPDGHGGSPHHFKQIQVAGLNGPVSAQGHVHPGFYQVRDGGAVLAVFGGRQRQGHGRGMFFAQHFGLLRGQIPAACGSGRDGKEPVAAQKLPGGHAGAVQAGIHLVLAFAQVQLHSQTLFTGVACQGFPEGVVAGVFRVDPGIDFDTAIVKAVPLVHHPLEFPALLVGFKVKFLTFIHKAIGRQSKVSLDAGFRHGLGGGIRVVIEV